MSVLIKDMVMPRCCYNCKLDLRTDVCSAFLEWQKEHPYSIKSNDRLPNCPLVEVSEPYDDCISRQAAIDTEGLDAQIRCEMCRNPMHTDRGCDGNCKYDEKLYERIIQILDERIKPLPSAQSDSCEYYALCRHGRDENKLRTRLKLCEYCHEDSDGYVSPIEKNSHAWLVRRGKTMKLRIGFKGEYRECDIYFCPMCGRRLNHS